MFLRQHLSQRLRQLRRTSPSRGKVSVGQSQPPRHHAQAIARRDTGENNAPAPTRTSKVVATGTLQLWRGSPHVHQWRSRTVTLDDCGNLRVVAPQSSGRRRPRRLVERPASLLLPAVGARALRPGRSENGPRSGWPRDMSAECGFVIDVPGRRTLYMCADSPTEAQVWIAHLESFAEGAAGRRLLR